MDYTFYNSPDGNTEIIFSFPPNKYNYITKKEKLLDISIIAPVFWTTMEAVHDEYYKYVHRSGAFPNDKQVILLGKNEARKLCYPDNLYGRKVVKVMEDDFIGFCQWQNVVTAIRV